MQGHNMKVNPQINRPTRFKNNQQQAKSVSDSMKQRLRQKQKLYYQQENQNNVSHRSSMELKVESRLSSIIDDYVEQMEQVPMLLDLSVDGDSPDKLNTSRFGNSRDRNSYDINSIYIEEDDDTGTKTRNRNNISVQDTQVPDHHTLDQFEDIQGMGRTPQDHKYGNKMSVIALEAYDQTLGNYQPPVTYQPLAQKSTQEILAAVLTSQTRMQKYIQALTEQAIAIKSKEYHSKDMITYLQQMNRRRKDIEITKMLTCLLVKIGESAVVGHSPEITTSKKGQFSINFSALKQKKSQQVLQGLSKFRKNSDKTPELISPQTNSEKINQLLNRLEEQDQTIETVRSQCEQIINNCAAAIHNLMKNKQKDQMGENVPGIMITPAQSPGGRKIQDDEMEELIKNSNEIHPRAVFNRLSQESKMKSKKRIQPNQSEGL